MCQRQWVSKIDINFLLSGCRMSIVNWIRKVKFESAANWYITVELIHKPQQEQFWRKTCCRRSCICFVVIFACISYLQYSCNPKRVPAGQIGKLGGCSTSSCEHVGNSRISSILAKSRASPALRQQQKDCKMGRQSVVIFAWGVFASIWWKLVGLVVIIFDQVFASISNVLVFVFVFVFKTTVKRLQNGWESVFNVISWTWNSVSFWKSKYFFGPKAKSLSDNSSAADISWNLKRN